MQDYKENTNKKDLLRRRLVRKFGKFQLNILEQYKPVPWNKDNIFRNGPGFKLKEFRYDKENTRNNDYKEALKRLAYE